MGRYDDVERRTGWGIPRGEGARTPVEAIADLVALAYDEDPATRRVAAKNMCPCHLQADVPQVWERLLEMTRDPDAGVRRDVVHALGDGSPRHRQDEIAQALDALRNDPDRGVRRNVNRVLEAYRRTGRVNVL